MPAFAYQETGSCKQMHSNCRNCCIYSMKYCQISPCFIGQIFLIFFQANRIKVKMFDHSLADLGGVPGARPLWDPILSFSHTFLPKVPVSEVHAPPTGNPGSATVIYHLQQVLNFLRGLHLNIVYLITISLIFNM